MSDNFSRDEVMEMHPKSKPLTPEGAEVPDPTPMQPPIGYKRQPSLADQIRQMVISERLAQEAAEAGAETFDEADDFDVGDDYDPTSPYEMDFDQASPAELRARRDAAMKEDKPEAPPSRSKKGKAAGDQPASSTEGQDGDEGSS